MRALTIPAPSVATRFATLLDVRLRESVLARLGALTSGRVRIVDAHGAHEAGTGAGEPVEVTVHDARFWSSLALRGSVGAGESYVRGEWDCDELVALLRLLARDAGARASLEGGLAMLARPLLRGLHALRDNTRDGSRRNVSAHYDLGNDVFALILDETMTYSCGLYERDDDDLESAQRAKIALACRKLDLQPEDHLLEIGTGWGALAIHAASVHGCRVTTTTLSQRQHDFAVERVKRAGLQGRVRVLLDDYRDLKGRHDKLVSIEMIEQVGPSRLPEYFGAIGRLLEPQGLALVQAITMADHAYRHHVREVDFIKAHVFPGTCIPSIAAIGDAVASSSDLRLVHLEDLTPHYVRTLRDWRVNLEAARGRLAELGHGRDFERAWRFYLAYCEAGFAERYLGDVQLLFARPENRREPIASRLS